MRLQFNGARDAALDRDIEAFWEEDETECYCCGMIVRKNQLRGPGCIYCLPDVDEPSQDEP